MKISVDHSDAFAGKPAPTWECISKWERACSRRGQWPQLTFCALLVLGMSACTVGPDFQKPEPQQITEWSKPAKPAASQAVAQTMDERWWEIFHDPKLSALTQRALIDNLDLKLASSRLQQSRAARQVITADRYPHTAATGSYGRERNSVVGLSDPSAKTATRRSTSGTPASLRLGSWTSGAACAAKLKPPTRPLKSPKTTVAACCCRYWPKPLRTTSSCAVCRTPEPSPNRISTSPGTV